MAALVVAVVLALGLVACREDSSPVDVSGGSKAQRALLREIVDRVDPTYVRGVRIGAPEKTWRPFGADDVQLYFDIAPGRPQGDWESWLIAGVYLFRSYREGLGTVVAMSSADGGSRLAGPPGQDPTRLLQLSKAVPGDADRFRAAVRRAAKTAGASVLEIEIRQPYDALAALVVLRVRDPARFLKERFMSFRRSFEDAKNGFEGTFLKILDSKGDPVVLDWNAGRGTLVFGHRTRPGLEGCDPTPISRPASLLPPACPV